MQFRHSHEAGVGEGHRDVSILRYELDHRVYLAREGKGQIERPSSYDLENSTLATSREAAGEKARFDNHRVARKQRRLDRFPLFPYPPVVRVA